MCIQMQVVQKASEAGIGLQHFQWLCPGVNVQNILTGRRHTQFYLPWQNRDRNEKDFISIIVFIWDNSAIIDALHE